MLACATAVVILVLVKIRPVKTMELSENSVLFDTFIVWLEQDQDDTLALIYAKLLLHTVVVPFVARTRCKFLRFEILSP